MNKTVSANETEIDMIEARDSRVPQDNGWTAVLGKGDTAEDSYAGPGMGFWDDAEYAAYCHDKWSAICVF